MTAPDVSQPVAPSRLLTVQEVMQRLRISESKCRRMIRAGELPAIRLGVGRRAVCIDERELEAWLRSEGWGRVIGRRRDLVEPLSAGALDQLAMLRDPRHLRFSGFEVRCTVCPRGREVQSA